MNGRIPRIHPGECQSLTDQIRRSSRTVCALLAGAWARPVRGDVRQQAEPGPHRGDEAQSWLDAAHDCGYIEADTRDILDTEWERIGGKLNRMSQHAESFCQYQSDSQLPSTNSSTHPSPPTSTPP